MLSILVKYEYVKKAKATGVYLKTQKTEEAITLNVFENQFNSTIIQKEKDEFEKIKTKLQIKELKRNKYISYIAIILSITSLIISILNIK